MRAEYKKISQLLHENSHRRISSVWHETVGDTYDIIKALSLCSSKSLARSQAEHRKWDWDLPVHVLWDIYANQDGKCAVTGVKLSHLKGTQRHKNPWAISIDRIDSDLGYIPQNVRLVCHWYNNAKNTWDDQVCLEAFNHWKKAERKNGKSN